ncbi:hypothetical protein XELAEV_180455112mg, partial [Xenopus laevis]
GIMKDTLRECNSDDKHCLSYLPLISPVYFVTFVLIAQFVLVNVVVAVLMKHLEESNKEAKEDAEMDAEIEMEMSRALTPASGGCTPASSGKGMEGGQDPLKSELPVLLKQTTGAVCQENVTLVIPESMEGTTLMNNTVPASSIYQQQALPLPIQPCVLGHEDGDFHKRDGLGSENLLAVKKISVSRMLSLPNDSYMFRPVLPAKSSYPLQVVETTEDSSPHGSIASLHSQAGENNSLLKVPVDCQPQPSVSNHQDPADMPKIPPPRACSRSPSLNRSLRRQEAIHMDSVDQGGDKDKDLDVESTESLQMGTPSVTTLVPNLLCSLNVSLQGIPQPSPRLSPQPRHSSVLTHNHVYSQHSIPSRPSSVSSGNSNPEESMFESSDLADEEVSHINSSAKGWRGSSNNRSHSVSPFISQSSSPPPLPPSLKNCNSTVSLAGSSGKDLKKFYSVDTQGFLAKPCWGEDQRRHSIEICPSIDDGDSCFDLSMEDKHCSSVLIRSDPEYINGVRRKKKMSPPCISIEPPMEDEGGTASRTKASENSMMLRRRTPSCESTAYRDSLDLSDNQLGDQISKTDRRTQVPCRNEHLIIHSYSYDQMDGNGFSDLLSNSGGSTPSSVFNEPVCFEMKQKDHNDLSGVSKGSLKTALEHVSNPTEDIIDNPL